MKNVLKLLLLVTLIVSLFSLIAAVPAPATSPFTRGFLRVVDAAEAQAYLGVSAGSTNFGDINITNANFWTSITVKGGATMLLQGTISGDAYVIVSGTANVLTNGLNLGAAYTAAKTKTPHGTALAAGNRYTIFLTPGVFDLGAGTLTLDTQYIDIIGLSSNTGEQNLVNSTVDLGDTVITSSTKPINLTAASQDITIANVCLKTTTSGNDSCIETTQSGYGNGGGLKIKNVLLAYGGSGNRITQWDKNFLGYWEDVRALDITGSTSTRAFGASVASGVTISGTFIRCKGEASAWGGENNVSITLSGTFIDCEGSANSFAGGSGTSTLSGVFLRNRNTLSAGGFMGGTSGTMSGYFEGNVGDSGNNNFGGGTMSGTMVGNSGGAVSWTSVTGKIVGNNLTGFTDNVMASRSVDAAVNIASTGWTNTYAKNATVYIDGTGLTYTVYNSAGTAIYTNAATVIHSTVNLQPAGKVIITAGTGVTGRATPF